MTRDEAASIIRKSELSAYADHLIAHLLPSVVISTARAEIDKFPIGASRFGGVPDVPQGFDWPKWTGSQLEGWANGAVRRTTLPEQPLEFIAQLDLADFNRFPACASLPARGMLYFFYDSVNQPWGFEPEDHLGSRVIFCEANPGELVRIGDPAGTLPCTLSFAEEWTIPDLEILGIKVEDGRDMIDELRQDICAPSPSYFNPIHRLLGWPETIQGDMRLECQCVLKGHSFGCGFDGTDSEIMKQEAADWQLLLQVDSDTENAGWMWGDVGRIYFWIHKDDLTNSRFENVRLILQCS